MFDSHYQITVGGFYFSFPAKLYVASVPVRWCAPEVLKEGSFSNKSDVWSFGSEFDCHFTILTAKFCSGKFSITEKIHTLG